MTQNCFICNLPSDYLGENEFFGASGQLGCELRNVFIVRNILGVPQSVCQNLIENIGNPSSWGISYCPTCIKIVNETEKVSERIKHLERRLKKLSTKIKSKLYKNCKEKDLSTESTCSSREPLDELRFQFSKEFALTTPTSLLNTGGNDVDSSKYNLKHSDLTGNNSNDFGEYIVDYTNTKVKVECVRPEENQTDFSGNENVWDEISNFSSEKEHRSDKSDSDGSSNEPLATRLSKRMHQRRKQRKPKIKRRYKKLEKVDTNEIVKIVMEPGTEIIPALNNFDPENEAEFDAKTRLEFFDQVSAANHKKIDCSLSTKESFQCLKCHHNFRSEISLEAHEKRVHEGIAAAFECKICKRSFKYRWELEKHLEKHLPGQKAFYCSLCPKRLKFSNEINYKAHVQRYHRGVEKPYMCSKCDETFKSPSAFEYHLKLKHKVILAEPITNTKRKELYRQKLKSGWKRVNKLYNFHCTETNCKKVYESEEARDIHVKKIHEVQTFSYSCIVCPEKFQKQSQLDAHLKTHDGMASPTQAQAKLLERYCEECDKTFKTRACLISHMKTTAHLEGPKPYMCELCSKTFQSNQYLAEHQRLVHYEVLGLDPIICEQCGKVFSKKKTLNWHIKSAHTKDFEFKCPLCPLGFQYENSLSTHMRKHTGEKPYECSICSKSFAMKYGLTTHMRIHTGEKPYKCPVCDRMFADKPTFNRHVEMHQGILHDCTVCSKQFRTKHSLRVHIKHHENNPNHSKTQKGKKGVRKRKIKVKATPEGTIHNEDTAVEVKYEVSEEIVHEISYDSPPEVGQNIIIESHEMAEFFTIPAVVE